MFDVDYVTDCCSSCPSLRGANLTRAERSDIAIIVDFPTDMEVKKDAFLQGDSGKFIRTLLTAYGIDVDECYIASALNCRPNKDKEAMLKNAMLSCRHRLVHEMKRVSPKKVLCLGTIGFSALLSAERNLPITKVRGKWHEAYGMKIMPTLPASMVLGIPDFFRDLERDIEKFATTDGPERTPDIELWVPESLKEAREAFAFLEQASVVSLDVETTGFSEYKERMLALGVGALYDDGHSGITVVLDEALLEKTGAWRLVAKQVNSIQMTVCHNLKFDFRWIKKYLEEFSLPYRPQNVHDTMMLSYALDERPVNGQTKPHGLKVQSRVRYDAPDYDIEMGKWLKVWATAHELERREMRLKMHTYLGLDCYYTARLLPDLLREVQEEDRLFNLYNDLLMPATLTFVEIESRGALIDRDFFEALNDNLKTREALIKERICGLIGKEDFNPGSPQQVAKALYEDLKCPKVTSARRGKQIGGKTSKEILSKMKRLPSVSAQEEVVEFIEAVLEYRAVSKTRGTYAQGILDRVDTDGRVRCDFNMAGTGTGRISASNPNLQNIPDSSHTGIEVRNGYVAPPGKVLIEADYSQLELRVAATLAQCPDFKQVFIDDRDVHQEVTWALFKKEKKDATKYERYMAKCCVFGVMYQRGAGSLANGPEMDYVEDNGGIRWSEDDVKEFFARMLKSWPRFNEWMLEQHALAYTQQYTELPMGNKRRWPFIPARDNGATGRQGVNTPIQGTAGQMTIWAICRIHRRLPEEAYIVSTVHDSILLEAWPHQVDEVLEIVREEMEENSFLESDVPFKSDADVAERWGQMGKFEWDSDTHVLSLVAVDEDA